MIRILILLIFFLPKIAMAFADDLCFDMNTGKMFNCVELEKTCQPGQINKYCKTALAKDAIDSASTSKYPRSMLHMDSTFYLAQAVGIHYDAAHRIAAYNQAIDLGEYVPVNLRGTPIVDPALCLTSKPPVECKYFTKPLNGLVRTSLATGGSFFHYGALNNPKNAPINGLNPLKNDPLVETMITNLRSWMLLDNFLCTAGLNGFQVGTCYLKSNGRPGEIFGVIPTLESSTHLDVPFKIQIQEQVLHQDESLIVYASSLGSYVGNTEAPDAKAGIYLHTLQDRISHHKCMDVTYLSAPYMTPGENFVANYPRNECHQAIHLLWHGWEIGVDQNQVPVADRTLYAALDLTYDELLIYAERRGWALAQAKDPKYKHEVINAIHQALQTPAPWDRINYLIRSMDNFGYARLPGH